MQPVVYAKPPWIDWFTRPPGSLVGCRPITTGQWACRASGRQWEQAPEQAPGEQDNREVATDTKAWITSRVACSR